MDTHGCLAKECRYVQDKSSLQELPVTAQGPSVRYRVNILNLEFDVASYLTVLTYSECARECVQLYTHGSWRARGTPCFIVTFTRAGVRVDTCAALDRTDP